MSTNRRPYTKAQSSSWWLDNPYYIKYMIREATSVFVLIYSLVLISGLFALTRGPEPFTNWLTAMNTPLMLILHGLILAAVAIHAFTWFKLTPKIMVVWLGDFKVPEAWLVIGQYAVLLAVTIASLFLTFLWF